jgi:cyclopropane fatty-acyl-phospholipid synthase-like methyltransferase
MDYDAEVRLHNEVLRRALGVQAREHVLDIGCGSGQITREAARMAQAGRALGVDISAPAAERARALGRLREVLATHVSGDGVWFDSRVWIVTARRI